MAEMKAEKAGAWMVPGGRCVELLAKARLASCRL